MSLSVLDDSQWLSAASIRLENSISLNPNRPIILDPLAGETYQLLIGDLLQAQAVDNLDIFRLFDRWIIQVDVCGLIRSVDERGKFCMLDVDDGTGCICCTVWRPIQIDRKHTNHDDPEMERVCEQLLQMSVHDRHSTSWQPRLPALGQLVHIRGRLKRFRGKLKINVYYCRILSNPIELLIQTEQREALKREIYTLAYDPKVTAQKLMSSRSWNTARNIVDQASEVLYEDGLLTFSKLDLCLNSQLVEALSMDELIAFDESETHCFIEPLATRKTSEAKDLQTMVDNLISCLLKTGWIYPASEPIGGDRAYHHIRDDRELKKAIRQIISAAQLSDVNAPGLSSSTILRLLRSDRSGDWSKLSLVALHRLLDLLETESLVYQTSALHYKLA